MTIRERRITSGSSAVPRALCTPSEQMFDFPDHQVLERRPLVAAHQDRVLTLALKNLEAANGHSA
jgi:hypothetical protein